MESIYKRDLVRSGAYLVAIVLLLALVAGLIEAGRPGAELWPAAGQASGHGTACSCGVVMTPTGAMSRCTCRPCKCGTKAR